LKLGEPYSPREIWPNRELPDWLMRRRYLSPGAKLCFAYLARFAGQDGPGLEEVGKALGVTGRQAAEYVKDLKTAGLLETERRGPGRGSRYVFLWPPDVQGQDMNDPACLARKDMNDVSSLADLDMNDPSYQAREDMKDPSCLEEPPLDSTSPPEVPSSDSERTPPIIPLKQPTKRLQDWLPFWAEFQAAYPKRRGGLDASEARKKFERLAKAGEDLAAIVAGARSYRAHCDADDKTGTEFVRQMTTWLNRRSWEDEFEPAAQPAGERFAAALNGHAPAAGPTIDPNERDDFRAQLTRCLLRQDPGEYQEVLGRYGDRLTERGLPAPAAKAALAEIEAAAGRFYAATKKTPGAARVAP
jgi:hypothetical protein